MTTFEAILEFFEAKVLTPNLEFLNRKFASEVAFLVGELRCFTSGKLFAQKLIQSENKGRESSGDPKDLAGKAGIPS